MGYDFAEVLKSTSGLGVPTPYLVDTQKTVKELEWIYKNGTVSLDLDFSGLTFPVTLRNTTVHLDTGRMDVHEFLGTDNTWNNPNAVCLWSGEDCINSMVGFRWDNEGISQGSEIESAEVIFNVTSYLYDDVNATWYFEDAASPTAFTTGLGNENISSRTLTNASVEWEDDYIIYGAVTLEGPDEALQEVVDEYTPTAFVLIGIPG